jgi:radical SAM protein (TIGR01212 family)
MTSPPARRYRSLSSSLHERFGVRVRSVTLDAGFTCPNVDGTVTTGGCVYCDNRSFSPNRRLPRSTLTAQVERGIAILSHRYGAERFIAYFQAGTNTHAPVARLRKLYDEALAHPLVVGLAIGTRPDSVPDEVLDLLEEYARARPVWLELGLQTIHDRSLDWMNRGHHFDAFLDAVERCQGRGLNLCAHVILGLPGESRDDMLATADALARLPIGAIKIHNLHVVRDTPLEGMYRRGEVAMMERDEYVGLICDFLERLPPDRVIQRLSGDAPPDYLVAPAWCLDKQGLLRAIDDELHRRDSWQGKKFAGCVAPLDSSSTRSRRIMLPLLAQPASREVNESPSAGAGASLPG